MSGQRLNTTLDGEHAPKLADLAARVHGNEGTLARSLLSSAIDGRDPDPANVADLDRLVRTQSLPSDTRKRFRTSLEPLRRFPRLGPELTGRWEGFWFLVGPWRWMLLAHVLDERRDRVVIVTMQDARTSSAASDG